ncbi:MAG TPA: hypothetical protein VN703_02855 [Candidatus Sulfopaludibacter sp.]|nr:hypothetical protein [Candidatus Sulfopaludibacter sp.]
MHPQIKKLRDRESLRIWDKSDRMFIHIQINKKEHYTCWERFISKDKRNWIKLNGFLSLQDVWNILKTLREKRENVLINEPN